MASSSSPAADSDSDGVSELDHDIVVFGATGYVGELTAVHLATSSPPGTRIALAGRSRGKLEAVRQRIPGAAQWPLVIADADDAAALAELAASTRVVVTTVGPYAKYGHLLAHACAAAGTDYVDLTGEVLFARESADRNHELAHATGARIVHSCGFDSVPSDLGVHVLYSAVHAAGDGELTDTTLVLTSASGGVSGGTIDSLRQQVDAVVAEPALRAVVASAYSLSPDRAAEPDLGRQSDTATVHGRDIHPSLEGWKAPFFMGSYNTRVVRRTNALLGYPYGKAFRYGEAMNVGSSALSRVTAPVVGGAITALVAGLAFAPTRWLLDRLLPAPGEGPSEKTRRTGYFICDIFTLTTSGTRWTTRVRAAGDPGYAATAVMIGEAALALVHNRDQLPRYGGGVLTPASGIGDAFVTRLRDAGFDIDAKRV